MNTPTLIDMPEPPSNPETPTEAPGTPNSTTTSLSALSTTAIKDGHRGTAFPHHDYGHSHRHTPSSNTLEAERADRISRLAGLERVSTARPANLTSNNPNTSVNVPGQIPGYFDVAGNPVYTTRMSTVGSASATGSAGGRTTTWASGSTKDDDADAMSMDAHSVYRDNEADHFSASASAMGVDEDDGMSDNTSLVGFGEGAGSTVSGPTYSRGNLQRNLGSQRELGGGGAPVSDRTTTTAEQARREARMVDGLATDEMGGGWVDIAAKGDAGMPTSTTPVGGRVGFEAAERIVRDRLDGGEARQAPLGSPDDSGLGKFYFEQEKK
ncbi:hypothetical protein BJ878DRAFT_75278 [Calycina marina]|uniref:Uncharacterized protein n=1 Tax=Calycina marina TaxID=1763456 RepID=A0A9P8CGC7_9HELO|nr:hypothetical protein BJ878DRAFT_75278 [Calycina marina]